MKRQGAAAAGRMSEPDAALAGARPFPKILGTPMPWQFGDITLAENGEILSGPDGLRRKQGQKQAQRGIDQDKSRPLAGPRRHNENRDGGDHGDYGRLRQLIDVLNSL